MGKPLLKTHRELKSIWSYGRFSKFSPQNDIGSREMHFDVKLHVHLHALIGNFPMRVCQVVSSFQCHM